MTNYCNIHAPVAFEKRCRIKLKIIWIIQLIKFVFRFSFWWKYLQTLVNEVLLTVFCFCLSSYYFPLNSHEVFVIVLRMILWNYQFVLSFCYILMQVNDQHKIIVCFRVVIRHHSTTWKKTHENHLMFFIELQLWIQIYFIMNNVIIATQRNSTTMASKETLLIFILHKRKQILFEISLFSSPFLHLASAVVPFTEWIFINTTTRE